MKCANPKCITNNEPMPTLFHVVDMDALRGSKNQDQDIDAALDALQKDSGYLFEPVETPPPYAAGTGSAAVRQTTNRDVAMRRAMGLPDKAADQK